jgi:hypothetical protein
MKRRLNAVLAAIGIVTFIGLPQDAEAGRRKKPRGQSVVENDPALSPEAIEASEERWTDYSRPGSYSSSSAPTLTARPDESVAFRERDQAPRPSAPQRAQAPAEAVVPATGAVATPPSQEASLETALPADTRQPLGASDKDTSSSEPYKHKGFVMSVQGGALGCTRSICSGSGGHDASPGPRVSGFLGGREVGAR